MYEARQMSLLRQPLAGKAAALSSDSSSATKGAAVDNKTTVGKKRKAAGDVATAYDTFQLEDLQRALAEQGVHLRKP